MAARYGQGNRILIGVVVDPKNWELWEQAKAYLEPARAQGGFDSVIEPDEELFAVLDPLEGLLAVATAWFDVENRFVEVKLVGGRDYRRWLAQLDEEIGRAALEAGATSLRAWGRRGWLKALRVRGWDSFKLDDGSMGYMRRLGGVKRLGNPPLFC